MASMFDRLRLALKRASVYITTTSPWERTARWFPHDFTNLVQEGYTKSELVYACIRLIANAASEATMRVYDRQREEIVGAKIGDAPANLRALIETPCPELKMSEFDFWENTLTVMHLAGVSYWEKERAARGNVVALWPLRPDTVEPVPGARGIDHYLLGQDKQVVPEKDILRFAFFDPLSPFGAVSPLQVAARQVNVDLDLQGYIKLLFQNDTVPRGVLTSEQYLPPHEADELKQRWRERQSSTRRGDIAVLSKGTTFQAIGGQIADLDAGGLHQLSESRVCSAFGVPPMLIGAMVGLEHATYANFESALLMFWRSTILPLWKKLRDQMNEEMAPDFGANGVAEWDLSQVWALQQEVWNQRKFWLSGLQAGGVSRAEFRTEVGLPPVAGPDVFLLPTSVAVEPTRIEVEARGQMVTPAAKQLDAPTAEEALYASEAQEWAQTPEWMQAARMDFKRRLDEITAAMRMRDYESLLSIPDEAWQAAQQGKSVEPPDEGERQ